MNNFFEITIPNNVQYIINVLEASKFKAFIVGGCVRDSLLGLDKSPSDWDITTDAKPADIQKLFDKSIDTGIKHGTVTVILNKKAYEITTFRIDGNYSDNRRPDYVEYTTNIEDDLSRRDFTVNAMAFNSSTGLIDPYNGREDLSKKIIRCVGDPDKRFQEDALRMLRAIRFSAKLGFEIEEKTLNSIKANSILILNVSTERIRDELTGIIMSDNPKKLSILHDSGILKLILPELDLCFTVAQNTPYHIYNVGEHSLVATSNVKNTKILRWAMLLHDIGKPLSKITVNGIDHFLGHATKSADLAEEVLKRLKFDNYSIQRIIAIIVNHSAQIKPLGKSVRQFLNKLGSDTFQDILEVQLADSRAKSLLVIDKKLQFINQTKDVLIQELKSNHCYSIDTLAINGNDLIEIGFKKGSLLGQVLNLLLQIVIAYPEQNKKDLLILKALKYQPKK